ncbi:hypothetical protein [Roseburia sp. 1XD42-34]|uniref:hypothetical protein n=1 Tax=Roseburia sp. 1XD42-34 TaxID=2305905 RepID=UPI0011C231A5|nr:hypothetical protein [Roseburia sp. 1XD42-34]
MKILSQRLLRDAQVLTVWKGTANILGLEVIRLIHMYQAEELFINKMNERLERTKQNSLIEEHLISDIEDGINQLKTYLRQWQ